MKTLICSPQPPLFTTTKASSFLHHSTTSLQNLSYHHHHHHHHHHLRSRSWKIHANNHFKKAIKRTLSTLSNLPLTNGNLMELLEYEVRNVDAEDYLPEVLNDRLDARMMVTFFVPFVTAFAMMFVLAVVKTEGIWDVPFWVPIFTFLFFIVLSAIGIGYAVASTCYDPDKEGSFLGIEEMKQNNKDAKQIIEEMWK